MAEHILKNTAATLSIVFSAGDADGAVTVTITDADGNVLVNAGATTLDETSSPEVDGRYTYTLLPQSTVKTLTVAWTGTFGGVVQTITSQAEVVGALLFNLLELRAVGNAELASTSTYPDETLADTRARITDQFERVCNVSFIPRYGKTVYDGEWRQTLWLNHREVNKLLSVTVAGTPMDAPTLAALDVYPEGRVVNLGGIWPGKWQIPSRNIIATYEYGMTQPPGEISRAGLVFAHWQLTTNQLADRWISMSQEFGVVRQSVPGTNSPTGILSVDEALRAYDRSHPIEVY